MLQIVVLCGLGPGVGGGVNADWRLKFLCWGKEYGLLLNLQVTLKAFGCTHYLKYGIVVVEE